MLNIPDDPWSSMPSAEVSDSQVMSAIDILIDAAVMIREKIRDNAPFNEIVAQVSVAKHALGAVSSTCSVKFLKRLPR